MSLLPESKEGLRYKILRSLEQLIIAVLRDWLPSLEVVSQARFIGVRLNYRFSRTESQLIFEVPKRSKSQLEWLGDQHFRLYGLHIGGWYVGLLDGTDQVYQSTPS